MSGISEAIEAADGQVKLAKLLGVSQQAVSGWKRRGWVPASRSAEIEQQTGVPRQRLVNPRLLELVGADDADES